MIITRTMLAMTNTTSCKAAAKPEMIAETRQIVLKEDCAQGNRLEVELRSSNRSFTLKNVTTTSSPRSHPSIASKRPKLMDALLKGRHSLTLTANGRAEATSSDRLGRVYRPATAMEGGKNGCIDFR
jgi:hypothetical protein